MKRRLLNLLVSVFSILGADLVLKAQPKVAEVALLLPGLAGALVVAGLAGILLWWEEGKYAEQK